MKTSLSDDEDIQSVAEGDEAPYDENCFTHCSSAEPKLFTQADLNNLVRDLQLTQKPSELLGSCLQEWNLLMPDVNVTGFRDRNDRFSKPFASEGELFFCKNIDIAHEPLVPSERLILSLLHIKLAHEKFCEGNEEG